MENSGDGGSIRIIIMVFVNDPFGSYYMSEGINSWLVTKNRRGWEEGGNERGSSSSKFS